MARVTVLGLGAMGSALAGALAMGGHTVTAWNRTRRLDRVKRLSVAGVGFAESAADAVAESPLCVACVLDYSATLETLQQADVADALRGRDLVCLCSGDPRSARELAEWAAEHGAGYLDGGIVGYPRHIGQASTLFVYSGDRDVFDAHATTLRSLAGDARYVGDEPGAAKSFYLAIWPFYYSMFAGFLESAALAASMGMPLPEFDSFAPSLAALALEHIDDATRRVIEGDYGGDQASVDVHWEGFQPIVEAFGRAGIVARMTDAFVAYLEAARAAGQGAGDVASIYLEIIGRLSRPWLGGHANEA